MYISMYVVPLFSFVTATRDGKQFVPGHGSLLCQVQVRQTGRQAKDTGHGSTRGIVSNVSQDGLRK